MTVAGWIDVFTHKNYKFIVIDSLKYCVKEKGLEIFGYCLMSNHLHMIARASGKYSLSDILRDFKKFTSKSIVNKIINKSESRCDWMLQFFREAAGHWKKAYYKIS
jgi:REP element-mobilizing transposase RayT